MNRLGRPPKYSTPEERAAAVRERRRRNYREAHPNARTYPLTDERARAWELRADGYTHVEIAKRIGVSKQSIHVWLRHTGRAWKLRPEDREPIAAALRAGDSPEQIAARFNYGERSIQQWISEGRLPTKGPALVACSACGVEFEATSRNALGAACSSRCRRALANASKIATRWRALGRRVTPEARELMIAQSLLRIEVTQGIGG